MAECMEEVDVGWVEWSRRLKLAICTATMRAQDMNSGPGEITTWTAQAVTDPTVHVQHNTPELNFGVVGSYQRLYEQVVKTTEEDVLLYLHDDVTCRESGWDERVLKEFEDEKVGVVGFGGALVHGSTDIYKTPYQLQQLGRSYYRSNVDDAEVHGERYTEACDVAVLDGFALAVRRGLLDRIGGWTALRCDFYCYDYSICALAHRHGYRVRYIGVRCHHHGGWTSVKGCAKEITSPEAYEQAHRWFYNEFRDVMPHGVV